jgi:hypothetical protein
MRFWNWLMHRGERKCELCGSWVKDVEVPVHYGRNNGGGGWIHPFHAVTSQKGRELINRMSEKDDPEIARLTSKGFREFYG